MAKSWARSCSYETRQRRQNRNGAGMNQAVIGSDATEPDATEPDAAEPDATEPDMSRRNTARSPSVSTSLPSAVTRTRRGT